MVSVDIISPFMGQTFQFFREWHLKFTTLLILVFDDYFTYGIILPNYFTKIKCFLVIVYKFLIKKFIYNKVVYFTFTMIQ